MNVSVLMSVYGKEKAEYLREALESLYHQTVLPKEIILVKDGPLTEELEAVIEEFTQTQQSLKVVELPESVQLGLALREGLKYCSCDLVARMDSDDISVPDRLSLQYEYMKNHPQVQVLGGWIQEFDDTGSLCGIRQTPEDVKKIKEYSKFRNPMNHVTVMFRKEAVIKAGGYQHYPGFEDYDLWTRMLLQNKCLHNIPNVLVQVRTNADMYARRGGITYFRKNVAFRNLQRKKGIINFAEYVLILVGVFCVAIQPVCLRKWIYRNLLRKQKT